MTILSDRIAGLSVISQFVRCAIDTNNCLLYSILVMVKQCNNLTVYYLFILFKISMIYMIHIDLSIFGNLVF